MNACYLKYTPYYSWIFMGIQGRQINLTIPRFIFRPSESPGHRGLERGQSAGIESTGAGARRLERGTGRGTFRLRTVVGSLGVGLG